MDTIIRPESTIAMTSLPLYFVGALSAALFLQTSIPQLDSFFPPIERLGLTAALLIAVRVLWKSNSDKDKVNADKDQKILEMATKATQIMAETTEKSTQIMSEAIATLKEFRRSSEDNSRAVKDLASKVSGLPCQEDTCRTDTDVWPKHKKTAH